MKTTEERLQSIAERWFLLEPFWFNIFCTHQLKRNDTLSIPFQTGQMRIEYSSIQIEKLSDRKLEDYLKAEIVRIALKHPYERVPLEPNKIALGFASDVTVNQAVPLNIPLLGYMDLGLPQGLSYEEYYNLLKDRPVTQKDYDKEDSRKTKKTCSRTNSKNNDDSDNFDGHSSGVQEDETGEQEELSEQQKALQKTELWQEDEIAKEEINAVIEKSKESDSWGKLSGRFKQMIEATLVIKIDYKRILSSFRASMISQQRELTRTRPNRRYGFDYMGSRYAFTTKLLIAVDVSGSVSDESLSQFFSIINRFFKYGIKNIDVIQFDCELTGDLMSLKKAKKSINVLGRGGTNFQPPVDYYASHLEYDGLIMFTDGEAPCPEIKSYRRILWILTSENDYEAAKDWINKLPNNRAIWIPDIKENRKNLKDMKYSDISTKYNKFNRRKLWDL